MGGHYRHSYLTISALDSPNANRGFLHPRPTRRTAKLSAKDDVWIRPQLPMRKQVFKTAALNQRGWALQERLLSTRILHYSKAELFWEYLTSTARESSAGEKRSAVDSRSTVDSDGENFKRTLFNVGHDPNALEDGAFALGQRIVKLYTRHSLTRNSEKLAVVAGLATIIAASTGAN